MEQFERILENFNDIGTERNFTYEDREKNKILAIIAYLLPILFFLPYLNDKNSEYTRFHANQSLTWLITLVVMGIVFKIVSFIPIIGFILAYLLYPCCVLAIDAGFAYGCMYGKAYKLPFIGDAIKAF